MYHTKLYHFLSCSALFLNMSGSKINSSKFYSRYNRLKHYRLCHRQLVRAKSTDEGESSFINAFCKYIQQWIFNQSNSVYKLFFDQFIFFKNRSRKYLFELSLKKEKKSRKVCHIPTWELTERDPAFIPSRKEASIRHPRNRGSDAV